MVAGAENQSDVAGRQGRFGSAEPRLGPGPATRAVQKMAVLPFVAAGVAVFVYSVCLAY